MQEEEHSGDRRMSNNEKIDKKMEKKEEEVGK